MKLRILFALFIFLVVVSPTFTYSTPKNNNVKEYVDSCLKEYKREAEYSELKLNSRLDLAEKKLALEDDVINFKKDTVSWWLGVLGILLAVFGIALPFFSFRLHSRISEQKATLDKEFQELQEKASSEISNLIKEGQQHIHKVASLRKTAETDSQVITQIRNDITIEKQEGEAVQSTKKETQEEDLDSTSDDLQGKLNKANHYNNIKEFKKAQELYEEIIVDNPEEKTTTNKNSIFNLYFNNAYIYSVNSDYFNAINNYTKAIEYYTKNYPPNIYPANIVLAYNNRAVSYIAIAAYKEAQNDINKAKAIDKSHHLIYHNEGVIAFNEDRYSDAIDYLKKAVELNKNYANSYLQLGNTYYKLNRFHSAIPQYDKAIEIDKNYASAYENRANAKYRIGLYNDAIRDATIAIELPDSSDEIKVKAYTIRSLCYSIIGEYKTAKRDYEKVLTIDSNNIQAWINIIEINILLNNTLQAQKQISEIDRDLLSYTYKFGYDFIKTILDIISSPKEAYDVPTLARTISDKYELPSEIAWSFIEIKNWLKREDSSYVTHPQRTAITELIQHLEVWRS